MEKLFFSVLNMSLTASYVILFILLVRLPLKKAPKSVSYALWGVAAFRLLCPFSFESIFSLLPSVPSAGAAPIPQAAFFQQSAGIAGGGAGPAAVPSASLSPAASVGTGSAQFLTRIGAYVWIIGVVSMLIYSAASVLILKRRLKNARNAEPGVFVADNLKTPFVLGVFRPKIYLPAGLTEEERGYIIRHERTHILRFDHIVKPFAFLILTIHWFNPLVWAAFFLMSADMELSCDERVIREMGFGIKKAYSSSLLSLSTGKRTVNGGPLAFGEGNVKGRIKNVLHYKRPAFRLIGISVTAALLVGIGLAANPKSMAAEKSTAAQEMYACRTQYVGDNSSVVNIADRLPVPDALARGRISLSTDRVPYGVETAYRTTAEEIEYYSDESHQEAFDRNAVLMFALIKNADSVVFSLSDGEKTVSLTRTREWANSAMGRDVWAGSDTPDRFSALYDETEEKFTESYKKQKQPVSLTEFTAAEGTAALAGGEKISVRLVMTDGKYFDQNYAGYGGGIYPENYQGSYEIRVLNSGGELLSKIGFQSNEWPEANFPGKFTLLFGDYNGDGNPDFSIGQWGSSSMSLYQIYTVLPDGTVKKISGEDISHLSHDFSVKFDQDNGSGFSARTYNNATGETKAVHYSWDKQKGTFYESASSPSEAGRQKGQGGGD